MSMSVRVGPTSLRRAWDYQEFSRWFVLDRLFASPEAAVAFAGLLAGSPIQVTQRLRRTDF
jgi:hypothetical protein